MGPFGPGDYLLSLDSGRIIAVNPGTKAYVDGFSMIANAMPQELMSQAAITNVSVTVERLGASDVIEGRPTERYGMVAQYTLRLMGQSNEHRQRIGCIDSAIDCLDQHAVHRNAPEGHGDRAVLRALCED